MGGNLRALQSANVLIGVAHFHRGSLAWPCSGTIPASTPPANTRFRVDNGSDYCPVESQAWEHVGTNALVWNPSFSIVVTRHLHLKPFRPQACHELFGRVNRVLHSVTSWVPTPTFLTPLFSRGMIRPDLTYRVRLRFGPFLLRTRAHRVPVRTPNGIKVRSRRKEIRT